GPSDDLRMGVAFAGARQVTVAGIPITLPASVDARLRNGDLLTVPPTRFRGPGGAELEGKGTVVIDRRIDATIDARGWPLASTPPPGLTAAPDRGWKGSFDGVITLTGKPLAPALAGALTFHGVGAAGLTIGDGVFSFRRDRQDLRFEGELGPYFQASGR